MTHKANGVPCRFDVYWRTVFPKSRFCRVLEGGHFGREFMNGCFGPVRNNSKGATSARNCVEFLWLTRDSETTSDCGLETR